MEPGFRKVFAPRRSRSIFSFRRKSDLVLFVGSLAMFGLGVTAFGAVFVMLHSKDTPAAAPPLAPLPVLPAPKARRVEPRPAPPPDIEPELDAEVPAPALPVEPSPEPAPAAPEKTKPAETGKDTTQKPVAKEAKTEKAPAQKDRPAATAPLPISGPFVLFQTGAEAPRKSADASAEVQADSITIDNQRALQISYRMLDGDWVRLSYPRRLNLSRAKRLQLSFRGEGAYNTFEVSIQDMDGTIASVAWPNRTGSAIWTSADVPLNILALWGGDGKMDWSNVRTIFFRVAKAPRDQGGAGRVVVRGFKIL